MQNFRFLENKKYFPDGFWCGKNVLDLGAGTGVAGIAAGTLGWAANNMYSMLRTLLSYFSASAVVTDLPEMVELMTANIDLNKSCITGCVNATTLVW